jgi:hypothetical protein
MVAKLLKKQILLHLHRLRGFGQPAQIVAMGGKFVTPISGCLTDVPRKCVGANPPMKVIP